MGRALAGWAIATAATVVLMPTTAAAAEPMPPNVIVILADDMRADELTYMPNVQRLLVNHGLTFRRAFVSNALCCPSRTTLLTGNYSHTTGVYTNGHGQFPEFGGYAGFMAHGNEIRTINYALDGAGYQTGIFGKFLNGINDNPPPAGWDSWATFAENNGRYLDYDLNEGGAITHYGSRARDYSTDVLARHAVEFVRTTPAEEPLFAFFTPHGPHGGAGRSPRRYDGDANGLNRPDGRAFNEANVTDKPQHIRSLPSLTSAKVRIVEEAKEDRIEALWAVDDAVRDIVRALIDTGRLENTMIVFTSDNGQEHGEHRWSYKLVPYEESVHVPLVMRFDLLGLSGATKALAANTDLAPTFAELAGIGFGPVDGVSLAPTFTGSAVREDVLLEHLYYGSKWDPPSYCGLRTRHALLVQYSTGEREFYDMHDDRAQVRNRPNDPRALELMDRLRELCSPLPPGMPGF